jgi:hypothetical protein
MYTISIDENGIIPGLGRGPITNVRVTTAQYNQLVKSGYKIKTFGNEVPLQVRRPAAPGERVQQIASVSKEANMDLSKERAAAKAPEAPAPVVEPAPAPAPVVEEKKEDEAPAAETVQAPVKSYSKKDLSNLSLEELDAILGPEAERPAGYGKAWVIKTILASQG